MSRRASLATERETHAERGGQGLRFLRRKYLLATELPAKRRKVDVETGLRAQLAEREVAPVPGLEQLLAEGLPHAAIMHTTQDTFKLPAQSACTPGDKMPEMAGKPAPRGRTVPVPSWWVKRIDEVIPEGMSDPEIARLVAPFVGGRMFDDSSISRCRRGIQPTIELVLAFSQVFNVPPPIVMARDEVEAHRLARVVSESSERLGRESEKAARLEGLDAEASALKAGVGNPENGHQTEPVDTVHASSRRVRSRRPQQR